MSTTRNLLSQGTLFLMLAGVWLLVGSPARAQDRDTRSDSDYSVGENRRAGADDDSRTDGRRSTSEARRLARFDYVSGKITWRPDDRASWSKAGVNQPLREGAQVWVTEGGRAEIRFDDGSLLRLGSGSVVTFKTVYSDREGEYTQVKMISGLATLRLRRERSLYQVDTPYVTVEANGPAKVRVGVADVVDIGVRQGRATVEGKQGKTTLHAGDYLALRDADSRYTLRDLPREDSWERWNEERDRQLDAAEHPVRTYPRPSYGPRTDVFVSLDFLFGSYNRPYHRHRW